MKVNYSTCTIPKIEPVMIEHVFSASPEKIFHELFEDEAEFFSRDIKNGARKKTAPTSYTDLNNVTLKLVKKAKVMVNNPMLKFSFTKFQFQFFENLNLIFKFIYERSKRNRYAHQNQIRYQRRLPCLSLPYRK